jgi:hypothetical protein
MWHYQGKQCDTGDPEDFDKWPSVNGTPGFVNHKSKEKNKIEDHICQIGDFILYSSLEMRHLIGYRSIAHFLHIPSQK